MLVCCPKCSTVDHNVEEDFMVKICLFLRSTSSANEDRSVEILNYKDLVALERFVYF